MSFSFKFKKIGNRNWYDSITQPETSAHEDETAGEAETGINEGSEENSTRLSLELLDEKKKASPELLLAQISALTEMMDRLMQSNFAKETTTASCRGTRHQYELPYGDVPGSSRLPTVAPLTFASYSPDTGFIFEKIVRGNEPVVGEEHVQVVTIDIPESSAVRSDS